MAKALSPAKVKEVRIHEDTGVAEVIVPDYQLSLAIGKEGQNARLAARLTGWRVDIKSETQLAEEEAGGSARRAEDDVEYAEGEWVPNADTGELEWHSAEGDVVTAEEWASEERAAARPSRSTSTPLRRRGGRGRRGARRSSASPRRSWRPTGRSWPAEEVVAVARRSWPSRTRSPAADDV